MSTDGYTHEEFMAVSGLAPVPALPEAARKNKPLPVPYERAVEAIKACQTLDEGKYFSDAADALAAWAKIYADDKVSREARALKLHAYRRMYKIAEKIAPRRDPGVTGRSRGARFALMEVGFDQKACEASRKLAGLSEEKFQSILSQAKIPAPSTLASVTLDKNPGLRAFNHKMTMFLAELRAERIVDALDEGPVTDIERQKILKRVVEAQVRLGKLERHIRKMTERKAVG